MLIKCDFPALLSLVSSSIRVASGSIRKQAKGKLNWEHNLCLLTYNYVFPGHFCQSKQIWTYQDGILLERNYCYYLERGLLQVGKNLKG